MLGAAWSWPWFPLGAAEGVGATVAARSANAEQDVDEMLGEALGVVQFRKSLELSGLTGLVLGLNPLGPFFWEGKTDFLYFKRLLGHWGMTLTHFLFISYFSAAARAARKAMAQKRAQEAEKAREEV